MIELAPHHKRGLVLLHSVLNASGMLGFADEARDVLDLKRLGGFVTNAVTLHSRTHAAPPNAVPRPNGLLLHTGLPNPGVRAALRHYEKTWRRLEIPVIVHLAATSPSETRHAAELLEHSDVLAGIELGFRDDVSIAEMVSGIHAARGGLPLLVCLPFGRAPDFAAPALNAGADALVLTALPRLSLEENGATVTGRFYSPENYAPTLAALQAIAELQLDVPLIASGGVASQGQIQELLTVGASAVQLDFILWRSPEIVGQGSQ